MVKSCVGVCVPPGVAHEVWPFVSHWVKAAAERGDLTTFAALEQSVLYGNGLIWLAFVHGGTDNLPSGVALTELIRSEKSLACVITACGGEDFRDWICLIHKIEKYARAEGCDCVRIFGRRGWARVLDDYQTKKIVLERQLK